MAVIDYDPSDADYLKVGFRCCQCGKETELVSSELPSVGKSYTAKVKANCGCTYETCYKDDVCCGTMEIVDLPTENVRFEFPIWWEHYEKCNTAYLDSMEEGTLLEKCIKDVSKLDEPCKTYLYGVLWCRVISLLDVYCHYTVARRVLCNEDTWGNFIDACGMHQEEKEWQKKDIENLLKRISFQSVDNLSKIFHSVFDLDLDAEEMAKLKTPVWLRNKLVHHQGRGPVGERIKVDKVQLMDLLDSVESLIDTIEKHMVCYDSQKAVRQAMNYKQNNQEL